MPCDASILMGCLQSAVSRLEELDAKAPEIFKSLRLGSEIDAIEGIHYQIGNKAFEVARTIMLEGEEDDIEFGE